MSDAASVSGAYVVAALGDGFKLDFVFLEGSGLNDNLNAVAEGELGGIPLCVVSLGSDGAGAGRLGMRGSAFMVSL